MNNNKFVRFSCIFLTALTVFGAGAGAAWLQTHITPPASLQSAATASRAPVNEQSYSDERSVAVEFAVTPGVKLRAAAEGRVTSSECRAGAVFASGEQLLSVNEKSVIVLHTAVPLWRDIELNVRGEDIAALQTELLRLGFQLKITGVVGTDTLLALMQLTFEAPDTYGFAVSIPVAQLVWVPSESIVISSCGLLNGEQISPDTEIAVLADVLTEVRVKNMPADLLPGERNIEIDTTIAEVDAAGAVRDPIALSAIAASPTYLSSRTTSAASTQQAEDGSEVKVSLLLRTPIQVGSVPPSAVYAIQGRLGCVLDGHTGVPVEVVGSQLGQTFVNFLGDSFPKTVVISPQNGASCR